MLTVLLVDLHCSLLGFLRSPKQKKTKNDVNCKKINPRIEGDCVSDRAPFTWLSAACVALQSCPESPEPCGAPPPSCCPDAFPPLSTPSGSASSPGSGSHGLLGTEHLKSAETTTQTQVYYCVLVCLYFFKGWSSTHLHFLPTWLSCLISSSCSILKALLRSTRRCARSRASISSSVSGWFCLRDRSASWILCFLSSAAFWIKST